MFGSISEPRCWNDFSFYYPLLAMDRVGWAWEWLKRDYEFQSTWRDMPRRKWTCDKVIKSALPNRLRRWGCIFADDHDDETFFWDPISDKSIVSFQAERIKFDSNPQDLFNINDIIHISKTLILPNGREHLMISDGMRHLQIFITHGTLLNGPVRLRCALKGFKEIEKKVLTLRRLCSCKRLGRLPRALYPPEPMAAGWINKLRAVDAVAAGATQREIAMTLFGERRTRADWSCSSDYLRLRVQRLVREGTRLVRGGYRDLLA